MSSHILIVYPRMTEIITRKVYSRKNGTFYILDAKGHRTDVEKVEPTDVNGYRIEYRIDWR
jgi:hypothetical protein